MKQIRLKNLTASDNLAFKPRSESVSPAVLTSDIRIVSAYSLTSCSSMSLTTDAVSSTSRLAVSQVNGVRLNATTPQDCAARRVPILKVLPQNKAASHTSASRPTKNWHSLVFLLFFVMCLVGFLPHIAVHKWTMPSCSVCMSVCLSHSCILSQRVNIPSDFFQYRVAAPFQFSVPSIMAIF